MYTTLVFLGTMPQRTIRVLLLGDGTVLILFFLPFYMQNIIVDGVGKSSLIQSLLNESFPTTVLQATADP